jgi:N-acetylgalactosamine-6-sulfatase
MMFLKNFFLSVLLLVFSIQSAERPNIIFIFADDWGWGDLSCHGHPYLKTPNIDRLAKEGTDFSHFTVSSGVCSPSRTSVMTGHFPSRYRINGHFAWVDSNAKRNMPDWLDPDTTTLPRLLQNAGYATAHFGKWHLGNDMVPDSPTPDKYGYDEYGAFNCSGKQMPVHEDVNRSIQFIEKSIKQSKPFFINLWMHESHTPFHTLEEYQKRYASLEEPHQIYGSVISHADDRVGQLLDKLDELNLSDNTLVIFSSDNGPARGKEGVALDVSFDTATGWGYGIGAAKGITGGRRGYKASLLQGGIGVPFLVRWPAKVPAGKVDDSSLISAVDLLPTFCSLAGAKLPEGYESDGLDQSQALFGKPYMKRTQPLYWKTGSSKGRGDHWSDLVMMKDNWKLLYNSNSKRTELYKFPEDVYEKNNLADDYPEIVEAMRNELLTFDHNLPSQANPNCFSSLRVKNK